MRMIKLLSNTDLGKDDKCLQSSSVTMIPAIMLLHFSLYSVDVFLSYGNLPPFPGSENGQKIWVNILETIH